MEREQFDVENNKFHCVECNKRISVEVAENKPRPVTCPDCGTVYSVSKNNKGGLSVTMQTESEPELITESEENLEEEFLDEKEEEEED